MPVRYEFAKELDRLHKDIVKMGAFIEESLSSMVLALKTNDKVLARHVMQNDDLIDDMEKKIQRECIIIVARQQPIATDLRDIISILKIATDIERIADHCEDICEYMLKLSDKITTEEIELVSIIADEVKSMISNTIDAYIRKDMELAKEMIKYDEVIDRHFENLLEELTVRMENDSELIRDLVNFIFIDKYFERMADHATNICEWILYYGTGQLYD